MKWSLRPPTSMTSNPAGEGHVRVVSPDLWDLFISRWLVCGSFARWLTLLFLHSSCGRQFLSLPLEISLIQGAFIGFRSRTTQVAQAVKRLKNLSENPLVESSWRRRWLLAPAMLFSVWVILVNDNSSVLGVVIFLYCKVRNVKQHLYRSYMNKALRVLENSKPDPKPLLTACPLPRF